MKPSLRILILAVLAVLAGLHLTAAPPQPTPQPENDVAPAPELPLLSAKPLKPLLTPQPVPEGKPRYIDPTKMTPDELHRALGWTPPPKLIDGKPVENMSDLVGVPAPVVILRPALKPTDNSQTLFLLAELDDPQQRAAAALLKKLPVPAQRIAVYANLMKKYRFAGWCLYIADTKTVNGVTTVRVIATPRVDGAIPTSGHEETYELTGETLKLVKTAVKGNPENVSIQ